MFIFQKKGEKASQNLGNVWHTSSCVFPAHKKEKIACVCPLWSVGRGQCRTGRTDIRLLGRVLVGLLVSSRHTVSVLVACVNFLAEELHWEEFCCLIRTGLLSTDGLLLVGQTLLCRQPGQDPAQRWCQGPQRGALHWKRWLWAVASFQLTGNRPLISMGFWDTLGWGGKPKAKPWRKPSSFLAWVPRMIHC